MLVVIQVLGTQWDGLWGWVSVYCIEFRFIGDRDLEGSFLVRERRE